MKVIHLIGGGDTGGAKTHVLNLLRELNNSIDARLFCFRKGDFSEDAEKMGIPIDVIESGNPVVGLRELKRLLAGEHVDIIHCHGARGNLMGNLIKKHLGAPVVTTVHSDYRLDYLGRPLGRLTYGNINALALRRFDYYIGVSDAMVDLLISRNFPPEKKLIQGLHHLINGRNPFAALRIPTGAPGSELVGNIGVDGDDEVWVLRQNHGGQRFCLVLGCVSGKQQPAGFVPAAGAADGFHEGGVQLIDDLPTFLGSGGPFFRSAHQPWLIHGFKEQMRVPVSEPLCDLGPETAQLLCYGIGVIL